DGFRVAIQRLPQILAWSLLSAVVGLLLKVIENSHKRAGQIVSAILGTAWSVTTYFVVPVLCVERVGPFAAVKRSVQTLKDTWGEGIIGNGGMGLVNFIIL